MRCAACWSHGRGAPRSAAKALGRVPRFISQAAYRFGAKSSLLTALGARELAASKKRQIKAMAAGADRIVAVCGWLGDALRRNGIADNKLVVSRQGIDRSFAGKATGRSERTGKFRLGYLGRCDRVKGLSILLDAVRLLPRDMPFELLIHAVANSEEARRERDSLISRTADDPRINFLPTVVHAELPAVMAGFDMLAVPSQWQETGPLVVLEAQACGVPVLGSDLGGIAELVTPGVDGHLVEFSDPAAWADAIRAAVAGNLPCLRRTRMARPVRTMADAARDMAAVYGGLA